MYIPAQFNIKDETLAFDIMKDIVLRPFFLKHNGMSYGTHLALFNIEHEHLKRKQR